MNSSSAQLHESGPLIRARGIGVHRGNRWVIRHVDLRVDRGKLVFLIGANGAGKTTCAKAILGLIEVSEGTAERLPGLRIEYVPQRLAISPFLPLTLRRLMTLTRKFPARDIDDALSAVGLERLGDPPIATLSGGEFQRLLLARALINRPDLLILDEPNQGVDIAGVKAMHELIERFRRDLNCGVLLISHDLRLAMEAGDDFCVLVPHEHDDDARATAGSAGSAEGHQETALG